MKQLQAKKAVVLGGSRGLGLGVVRALHDEGADVLCLARDPARLDAVRAEIPGIKTLAGDISDPMTAPRVLGEVRPEIVVLAAGATPRMAPVHEQSWEDFDRVWQTDTRAAFYLGKQAMTQPLASGSVVVIVSSGAAVNGSNLSGGYAGAKRMQWFLTKYLDAESKRASLGIRFVALLPKQLVAETDLGRAAASAYAAREGISLEKFVQRFEVPLTPDGFGAGVVSLITKPELAEGTVFTISGSGVERLE